MKKLLSLLILLNICFYGYSQTDPELTEFIQEFEYITDSLEIDWDINDTVSLSLDQIRDTLFSNIDTANYNTLRLFDRVMESRELISLFNGDSLNDTMNYIYWYALYEQIRLSELIPTDILAVYDNVAAGIEFINGIDIEKDIIEYPVGILLKEYNFWNFADQNEFESAISTQNYQIQESATILNYVDTGIVIAIQPLIHINYESEFYLTYHDDFINSDFGINRIEVDYGDGYMLLSESTPVYIRATDTLTVLNFRLSLSSRQVFYCRSVIVNENPVPANRDLAGDEPNLKFDEEYNGITMRYGVYFACDQVRIQQTNKPVFFIPGFQPAPVHRFLESLYNQENHEGLLADLRASGHTVIVVTFWPHHKNIEDQSVLVEMLINEFNAIKMSTADEMYIDHGAVTVIPGQASYYENIIVGYSAGGQAARLALNRMEYLNINFGTPHHHTKLYVSFDSPHNGANIGLSDQYVAKNLLTVFPTATSATAASVLEINLNTVAATQLARYYKTSTNNSSSDVARNNLMSTMYSYNHSKTNPAVPGFPAFSRNIAVVLGRYDGQTLPEYSAGDQLFGKIAIATPSNWGVITYERIRTWSAKNTNNHTFYKRYFSGVYYGIPVMAWADKTSNYTYEFDNCAGSYRNDLHSVANSVIRLRPLAGIGINYLQDDNGNNHNIGFIPSVSALAINEAYWGTDASFNFKDEFLLFNNYSQLTIPPNTVNQSDFYGYPHLGNPSNHFSITPFEAFYINQENEKHIATHSFDEAVTAVDLKFFLLDEMDPYIVALQNYKTGWNVNSTQEYIAWYHGNGQVLIGNLVTPKTNPGDYIIEENANIRTTSDNLIHIFSGFHAQVGCVFHAYIEPENCDNNHAPENYDDYENQTSDEWMQDTHNSTDESLPDNVDLLSFQIIPNPNTGSFTLEILSNLNAGSNVYIFDLTGKLVFENVVNEQRSTYDLNLDKGIYIVRITVDGKNSTQKLIIQ